MFPFSRRAQSWSMRRASVPAPGTPTNRALRPPLLSAALLSAALLVGCGPDPVNPGPGPVIVPPGSYSVSGTVSLPVLAAAALSLNTSSSLPDSAPNWNAPHVPGELLILNASPAALGQAALGQAALGQATLGQATLGQATLGRAGLSGLQTQALGQNSGGLVRVTVPAGQDEAAYAARLGRAGLDAQPNYLYSALGLPRVVPNDPGYPGNAGIAVGGGVFDQDYLTRIRAQDGWNALADAGLRPVGAVTAVLDTGIDAGHPDLQGRRLPGYDFGDNDPNPAEAPAGDVGHGTSSAGIIGAGGNNGLGLTGLTWSGQTILPVKVFADSGSASTAALAQGLDYAVKQGAKVVNMSLGLVGVNTDKVLAASLKAAADAGVTLVAAAGNTPGDGLYFPASDPNVLAVGALGRSDDLACYSARPAGSQKALDLVAPGGNAGSGSPSCLITSDDDILDLNDRSVPSSARSKNGYSLRAGTSEAAPQVSGAASLLRGFRPDLSAAQVKAILTGSARKVAGGPLLDVGAAIRAAAAQPLNTARPYALSVQAVSGGVLAKTFTGSGSLPAGASSVPYSLAGLAPGTYTLTAALTVGGQMYSGSGSVTLSADVGGQNIQTR